MHGFLYVLDEPRPYLVLETAQALASGTGGQASSCYLNPTLPNPRMSLPVALKVHTVGILNVWQSERACVFVNPHVN